MVYLIKMSETISEMLSFSTESIEDFALDVRLGKNWKCCTLKRGEGGTENLCDFSFIMGYIPVCNQRVYDIIAKQPIYNKVDFLPVEIDGSKYYVIRPTEILNNIVNKRKSKISYFPDGQISWVYKFVFYPFHTNSPLFKVPELIEKFFATEDFVKCVKENNFTGIEFEPCEEVKPSILDKIFK